MGIISEYSNILLPAGSSFFLPVDQNQVPDINKQPYALAENKHGVFYMYRVYQQANPAKQAKIPETYRDHAFLFLFRGDPLYKKPQEKHQLSQKAHDDPYTVPV
jgi:hypothetical protein